MLLFLQRNILHWAIEAGVLRANDKRFVNWDNIYRCMLLRSQATPATKYGNFPFHLNVFFQSL